MIKINKWRVLEALAKNQNSMTQLAGAMGCHTKTLARKFKTGFEPHEVRALCFYLGVPVEGLTDELEVEK